VAGIFAVVADLIKNALDPGASDKLPPAPAVIGDLGAWLDNLKDLSLEIDGDLSKLQRLLDKFKLPNDAGDSVLVRMLQYQFPRIGEALTLLGIIEYEFAGGQLQRHHIRWDRINQLLGSPGSLLSGPYLSAKFLIDDPLPGAVNLHLLTVQFAALLLAPRPLLLLEHDAKGMGALPAHPDDGDLGFQAANPWKPVNDAPWLFKLQIPTPGALQGLKPDAAGVQVFLDYLKSQEIALPNPVDPLHIPDLPALPAPEINSPPLVLPEFHRGSMQFGLVGRVNTPGDLYKSFAVAPGWQLTVDGPKGASPNDPPGFNLVYDGARWTLAIDRWEPNSRLLQANLQRTDPDPLSFVKTAGLFIEADRISAFGRLNAPGGADPLFSLGLTIAGLRAGLSSDYLAILGIGDALQVALDLAAIYDQGRGLRVTGGASGTPGDAGPPALGIDFVQPINQSFGAGGASLTVQQVRLRIESGFEGGGLALRAKLRLSVSAVLGPVSATMTDFGAWVGLTGGQSFHVLGPSGVGVNIDAGIVTGGGFMAESPPDSGRFMGALALKVLAIGVGAFGIYEKTKAGNTSFVVVVGARFPGIQLGFGFMITGIGGLVGINRRADVDQLSARLSSGAAGNVLFCEDPVRNAPALLPDLAAFFPPADGVFILGPTLQLSWLYIVRLDVGVLIELPGPSKVIVVGSARAVIPGLGSAVPLVNLRIDVIGGVDNPAALIFFDASLVDSSVLGIFQLAGDTSFRFGYGANPYVLLSIGGFHPSYNPEPIKIRRLARVSAGYSINTGIHIWLRQEFYFAFTPNTLQLGGRIEAGLEIGPVGAHGFFEFDALVQFKPFYFVFRISAGFDIEFGDVSLCSVNIDGQVSGPGPLVIAASVSFKILFVRFSFDQTFTLGSGNGDVQRVDVNVLKVLSDEAARVENIHVEDAEHAVILKKSTVEGIALAPASGKITWTQRLAPFGLRLQRFGGAPLAREYQVSLAPDISVADAREIFGLGSYADITQAQALNNDAFHREKAGVTLNSSVGPAGAGLAVTVNVQVYHIPRHTFIFLNVAAWHVAAGLHGALNAAGGKAKVDPSPAIVQVHDEVWSSHGPGGAVTGNLSPFQAFQVARAAGGFAAPAAEPALDLAGV
jgi:hypothetical protein